LSRLQQQVEDAQFVARLAKLTKENPQVDDLLKRGSVHVMQIGPLVLVGIPGELFVEYALEMKQRVRQLTDRPMMLVGYANGYIGYLVTPRAIATGGYEQAAARVDSSTGRVLTEAAMELVEEVVKK
jgi:hypothetical protein